MMNNLQERMQSAGAGVPQALSPGDSPPEVTETSLRPLRLEEIPGEIARMREAAGLSQGQLGERFGYPQQVVSDIETRPDKRKLGLRTLGRIADALDHDVLVLFLPRSKS